jgi:hypothetical protein
MLRTRNITLTATAQELTIDDTVDNPNSMSIQNTSVTGNAYIGNKDVTLSNYGHKLFPGQTFTIDLNRNDQIWSVGDSGVTVAVFILERT